MADWNAKYPQLALRAPFNAKEWADFDVIEVDGPGRNSKRS
jgi:hypothetical protein